MSYPLSGKQCCARSGGAQASRHVCVSVRRPRPGRILTRTSRRAKRAAGHGALLHPRTGRGPTGRPGTTVYHLPRPRARLTPTPNQTTLTLTPCTSEFRANGIPECVKLNMIQRYAIRFVDNHP